jgi:hypothetical protein
LRHTLDAAVRDNLDVFNPAAGMIASGMSAGLFFVGLVALIAALVATYVRPLWMQAGLAVVVAVLMATNVATPGALFRDAAFYLLAIVVLWLGVTRVARFNMVGYFLFAAMMALVPGAIELLKQPNAYFHANGYAVAAFALALLAWPVLSWLRGTAKETASQDNSSLR